MSSTRDDDVTPSLETPYQVSEPSAVTQPTGRHVRRATVQAIVADGTPILANQDDAPTLRSAQPTVTAGAELYDDSHVDSEPTLRPSVAQVRDARVAVLARKYENPRSAEHDARFKLLTEKLRSLDPRVSDAEYDALGKSFDALQDSGDVLAEIKRDFGV